MGILEVGGFCLSQPVPLNVAGWGWEPAVHSLPHHVCHQFGVGNVSALCCLFPSSPDLPPPPTWREEEALGLCQQLALGPGERWMQGRPAVPGIRQPVWSHKLAGPRLAKGSVLHCPARWRANLEVLPMGDMLLYLLAPTSSCWRLLGHSAAFPFCAWQRGVNLPLQGCAWIRCWVRAALGLL